MANVVDYHDVDFGNPKSVGYLRYILIEAIRYGAEDRLNMGIIEDYVDDLIEAALGLSPAGAAKGG